MTIDPLLIPILTAIIGALSGIVGGGFTGRRQARLEREKWIRNISDVFTNELRSTVKELTTKAAGATHSMVWLCWLAKYGRNQLTQDRIDQYNDEMHVLLPEILGLHAVIAGMDGDVYLKLKPLIDNIFMTDGLVGQAGLTFELSKSESAENLAKLYDKTSHLEADLSITVAEAIKPYAVITESHEIRSTT